jgi:thiol-disulfide isomerase/thioredoxin
MKLLTLKFFILLLVFFISNVVNSKELTDLKNLVIYEDQKKISEISFKNEKDRNVSLSEYENKLLILNFWATWCEPCKEEMPSLQNLQNNSNFKNLKILPINIGQEDKNSIKKFFLDVEINSFEIFYDFDVKLAKKFSLRGIPTSILINKDGYEFAKIIGSIDFEDPKFVNWLLNYD